MTHPDNLIRMANQIGTFFESQPDRTQALLDTATHLKKFWTPDMRRAFLAQVDGLAHPPVHEMVLAAVHAHRALIA